MRLYLYCCVFCCFIYKVYAGALGFCPESFTLLFFIKCCSMALSNEFLNTATYGRNPKTRALPKFTLEPACSEPADFSLIL
jgi:hypothetical protein